MRYGRVTSKFGEPRPGTPTGKHLGLDIVFGAYGTAIYPAEAGRVIFSGQSWGYRYIDGILRRVADYGVIIEGQKYYHAYWHTQSRELPPVGKTVSVANKIGLQTDHLHWGVFRKLGPFVSISHAEISGWAVDPLTTGLWPGGDDEMIDKKYLKGNLFRYDDSGDIYWKVPSPEVFSKYIGDWGLVEVKPRPTIEKKFLKGFVFRHENDPRVFWHIPNAEAFHKYIRDWGLVEIRKPVSTKFNQVKKLVEQLYSIVRG